MGSFLYTVLILAMAGHSSANWCICKEGISDTVLQKTLDYACGAGADCGPIHQNGGCYNPNTVRAHCSYAVNSFFQRKGQAQGTCDFAGTAYVITSDPSASGCVYPATPSAAGTGTTPSMTTPSTTPSTTTPSTTTPSITTPSTTTPSTTTPSTTSPYTGTPTGVYGGINSGMGPSGVGINTDISHGGFMLQNTRMFLPFSVTLLFAGLMLLWG